MNTVAYIGGTFDLVHYGHMRLFRAAKERFNRVVVSVNRDEFVARFKKRLPVMVLSERMESVSSCRWVDNVVENIGDEDSRPAILAAGATHIVHGSDWERDSLVKQLGLTEEWLAHLEIDLVYFPYTTSISTTAIVNRIRKGGLA